MFDLIYKILKSVCKDFSTILHVVISFFTNLVRKGKFSGKLLWLATSPARYRLFKKYGFMIVFLLTEPFVAIATCNHYNRFVADKLLTKVTCFSLVLFFFIGVKH